MGVTIRAARPEDIPGMTDLLVQLFSIEADFAPDAEKQVRGLSVLVAGELVRDILCPECGCVMTGPTI